MILEVPIDLLPPLRDVKHSLLYAYQYLLLLKNTVAQDHRERFEESLSFIHEFVATGKIKRLQRLMTLTIIAEYPLKRTAYCITMTSALSVALSKRIRNGLSLNQRITSTWADGKRFLHEIIQSFYPDYQFKLVDKVVPKAISDLLTFEHWDALKKVNTQQELRQTIQIMLDRIEDEVLESDIRTIDVDFPVDDFVYNELMIPRLVHLLPNG